jgi:hypothetical protein
VNIQDKEKIKQFLSRLLRTNVNTLLGCVAEGEFICDSSGKPLQVQELSNNFGSSEPEKPLPPNAHRMALVTASFQVNNNFYCQS